MFEEGERYRIEGKSVDMFVVGIDKETADSVLLAIFWVNQETGAMLSADEITIKKADFSKWKKVEVT
jgi:hypothetical protein